MDVGLLYNEQTGKFESTLPSTGTRNPLVTEAGVQTLTNKTWNDPTVVLAADDVIPITGGTFVFTKGSSSAHTLAAPTALGTVLTLCAGSAQAHVITATGLIDDGITGGSKTTITLASFIGANIVLQCVQAGKWMVISKNAVTSVT